jgi:hypothetical protein
MRSHWLIAALVLLPSLAGATGIASSFGNSLGVSGNAHAARIAYCSNNSCEVFYLRGKDAKATLEAFASAYFYGVSEFAELKQFQSQSPPDFVANTLALYSAVCARPWPRAAAQCVAEYLAKSRPIQARFVHLQEGRRMVIPFVPALTIGRARHDT